MNPHLNPDQIYTLLDRPEGDRSAQEHLLSCAPCRAEVASLRDSLTNFRLAATNFSLLHTPTRLLDPTPRPRFFTIPRAAWAGGLVAAMALCTASISVLHKPAVPVNPAAQTTGNPAPDAQSDDALLNGIDTDLSTSVPPSLQPLDVTAASENTTTSSPN
jgi:hypothetical protein